MEIWHTLVDYDGTTLAHVAAKHGYPKEWSLADRDGWTVAHVAAVYGHLPPDFTGWHWADKSGRTVAHVAAK